MDRRHYASILIILLLVMVIVGFSIIKMLTNEPASTPPMIYTYDFSPEIARATQGATPQVNLTLTSQSSAKMAIPIELELFGYNRTIEGFDTIETYGWGGGSDYWDTSVVQERVFNYSLSFNKLTLQPGMPNSTIITFSFADDAPVGRYLLFLYLGNIEFLSPPGEYEVSYSSEDVFGIIVTSSE
jgi:hypothetical protein